MRYKTCVSIAERTPRRLAARLETALAKSEYAELRLDFLRPADVPRALELAGRRLRRCVCTLRPKREGGRFEWAETERIAILKRVASHRPYLVDVEFSAVSKDAGLAGHIRSAGSTALVSWHNHSRTPARAHLVKRLREMRKFSDHLKIVTAARSAGDAARVLSLYGMAADTRLVAFAMGDAGRVSRILCLYLGSPYTYVSMGRAVAPGQLGVDEVRRIAGLRGR